MKRTCCPARLVAFIRVRRLLKMVVYILASFFNNVKYLYQIISYALRTYETGMKGAVLQSVMAMVGSMINERPLVYLPTPPFAFVTVMGQQSSRWLATAPGALTSYLFPVDSVPGSLPR